jgi:hypothetical protein
MKDEKESIGIAAFFILHPSSFILDIECLVKLLS